MTEKIDYLEWKPYNYQCVHYRGFRLSMQPTKISQIETGV